MVLCKDSKHKCATIEFFCARIGDKQCAATMKLVCNNKGIVVIGPSILVAMAKYGRLTPDYPQHLP
jgi:hypothetical protein